MCELLLFLIQAGFSYEVEFIGGLSSNISSSLYMEFGVNRDVYWNRCAISLAPAVNI